MLKKFFLNFLSSFAAVWVALGLFSVTAVIVIVALVGKAGMSGGEVESVSKHSILRISLDGAIAEREAPADINYMDLVNGDFEKAQTLDVLTEAIREAKTNKNIDLIYLSCEHLAASPATLHALRSALEDFKESGKKIYAYGDSYTTGSYYVASVADSLFVNAEGSIGLQGLGGTTLFMKDFFDKVGVQFEVVKVGTFKSAVEPYILNEMSEPARAQLDTLYGNMWRFMRNEMAKPRKLTAEAIDRLINTDNIMLQDGRFAAKAHLADKAIFKRQLDGILADAAGVDVKKLNFVSPSTLVGQTDWGMEYGSKRQLAVLYATGEIMEGSKTGINCETLVPVITKLAEDDNVKGLVLRVNSPGGSVFGSEQIGEALEYFKSKGKPLAVSMGDYAASGGYWISCGADRIFADPLTITGSIGIFGLIPNVEGLAAKVGINPVNVSTNPEANFPSLFKSMSPEQHAAMQHFVEKGYERFIDRVATGRDMAPSKVRLIAEGRVWDASKALEIGLVDQLGELEDACEWVKEKVDDGDKLDIAVYPKYEPGFWDMIAPQAQTAMMKMLTDKIMSLAPDAVFGQMAVNIVTRRPVQARMMEIKVIP